MGTARDRIRTRVLSERLRSTVVTLDNGVEVEVRQTTVGQMLDAINETDLKRRMARLLIESCYVPGTDEKVFEEADFESLLKLPAGGVYQKLMDAINERQLPKELEEAKKS